MIRSYVVAETRVKVGLYIYAQLDKLIICMRIEYVHEGNH